ncbi:sensor histidine kinase [Marinibaculum pumilum]|uniref:histidine kinase n=1 Tax=Marinibaculum pumilum TaxID=1766165 RepID=A0ABV7L6I5_9PROT
MPYRRAAIPVLAALALILAASVGYSAYRLTMLNVQTAQEVSDSRWLLGQIEVEFHRFRGAAARHVLGDPTVSHNDLLQRYEILWSRFPALLAGDESAPLRSVAMFGREVATIFAAVRALEPEVIAMAGAQPHDLQHLSGLLNPIERDIRALVLDHLARDRWAKPYRTSVLGDPENELILAIGMFVVAAALLLWLLQREIRRSEAEVRQRKRTEARLREALIAEQGASDSKSHFLANVSHELRTPLNAIIGFSEVLIGGFFAPLDKRSLEYVTDIHSSAKHLHKLVDEILDLALVEAGAMMLDETLLRVDAVLQACSDMTRVQAVQRNMQIVIECEPDLPLLYGDETKIRQIVLNLLSNSIKYSHAGDTISLTAKLCDARGLTLAVADQGPGLSERQLEDIFEPFNRSTSDSYTRTCDHGGAGLGLTIARTLTELHDGTIEIHSRIGAGTTVTIHLPAARLVSVAGVAMAEVSSPEGSVDATPSGRPWAVSATWSRLAGKTDG